jgi:hypothetical protein
MYDMANTYFISLMENYQSDTESDSIYRAQADILDFSSGIKAK